MPFDVNEDDDQQYQEENGFRLPIPRTAVATTDAKGAAPVKTASNPSPVPGMDIPGATMGHDDAVNQAMTASAGKMPPAPPQDDQLSNLIQQRQQAGQPLDRTNPKYKMGLGGKIAGTLANFASGFGGKGPVVYTGRGATNARYGQDEADRQKQAGNLDTAIANREKLNEENRKGFDSAVKQAYESQIGSARQDTARARQSTADAQQQTADVKQQLADQKGKNIIDERIANANKMGLTGKDRKLYLANGKLPEGMTDYQQARLDQENRRITDSETRDKNKPNGGRGNGTPTFKDAAAVDKYSDQFYRAERAKVEQEKTRLEQQKKNWKVLNPDATDEQIKAAMDSLDNQKQQVEDEYGRRAADFEERKKGYYAELENKSGPTAKQASGKDFGPAPAGSTEGRTGALPDGTKVIVRKGRIVGQ